MSQVFIQDVMLCDRDRSDEIKSYAIVAQVKIHPGSCHVPVLTFTRTNKNALVR